MALTDRTLRGLAWAAAALFVVTTLVSVVTYLVTTRSSPTGAPAAGSRS